MCKIATCAVSKRLMNMQNNTRNRESNRIHQPEAQDSKTCPTFPGMCGGHSIPIKHTGLPLQIQYFNIFCVLRSRPTLVTAASGPRAKALTLRVTCQGLFLSRAALKRHISHAKACCNAGMGSRDMPIQVRAVEVMAGGGGAAGPAPSVHHQEPEYLAGNATCITQTQSLSHV